MISSIIQTLLKIKFQPNMSEQEKKRQRSNDLLYAKIKESKEIYFLIEKEHY